MKKTLLLLVASLSLLLATAAPASAQWFHRIGHVGKSKTKKAEHSNKRLKHHDKQKTKKRNPDHDERRRRKEARRQQKRREEGPRLAPVTPEPEPEKSNP